MRASFSAMRRRLVWMLWATGFTALPQQPQFQGRSNEVLVPVSVVTKDGKPVDHLRAEDFVVLSGGVPEKVNLISSLESFPLPVHAVIVVQADEDSDAALAKIKKTGSLVSGYITNQIDSPAPSLTALITANNGIKVVQDFTRDPDVVNDAFRKLKGTGNSYRLLDAVSEACDLLSATTEPARNVVVVISGTKDLGSKAHFASVAEKLQRSDVTVYTLSYSEFTTPFTQSAQSRSSSEDEPGVYDPDDKADSILPPLIGILVQAAKKNVAQALSTISGGSHEKFTTLRGLETQLISIGTEVHTRYVLTFVPPTNQGTGFHTLSVSVPGLKNARVHARAGYWTSDGQSDSAH